jgi:nicotinate-nucleotide adenylyltransferase
MTRIALFGGTFDPVHIGHLLMARTAQEEMGFDKVIFIPNAQPPHRRSSTLFNAEDRIAMARLAVAYNGAFEVSDFEVRKGGRSYSVDTVVHFREAYPAPAKLFFIVGGDAINQIHTWKDIEAIKKMCTFVSVNRPGYPRGMARLRYHALSMHGIDISSTEIRKRIQQGRSIQYLVPESVLGYIREHRLAKI